LLNFIHGKKYTNEKSLPHHNFCFIDFRIFKSFDELNDFLNSISEQEFDKYISAINMFLESTEFNKFSEITFAKKMLNAIQHENN
jgi:hypothetical protein